MKLSASKDVDPFRYRHCLITYLIVDVHVVELGIFSTRYEDFLMFGRNPWPPPSIGDEGTSLAEHMNPFTPVRRINYLPRKSGPL